MYIPLLSEQYAADAADGVVRGVTLSAGDTEIVKTDGGGNGHSISRCVVDLTGVTDAALFAVVASAAGSGTVDVEYRPVSGGAFATLVSGVAAASTGAVAGAWGAIPVAARTVVELRLVSLGVAANTAWGVVSAGLQTR